MFQKYNYILLEKIKEKVHIKFLNHRAGTKRAKQVRLKHSTRFENKVILRIFLQR